MNSSCQPVTQSTVTLVFHGATGSNSNLFLWCVWSFWCLFYCVGPLGVASQQVVEKLHFLIGALNQFGHLGVIIHNIIEEFVNLKIKMERKIILVLIFCKTFNIKANNIKANAESRTLYKNKLVSVSITSSIEGVLPQQHYLIKELSWPPNSSGCKIICLSPLWTGMAMYGRHSESWQRNQSLWALVCAIFLYPLESS